jgi:Acyl-CoA dehydrogenase, N-terminal domain
LTADQELFVDTTRRFLEQECPITEVRRPHDEVEAGFEPGYWRRGAELGWTAGTSPSAALRRFELPGYSIDVAH